MYVEGEDIESTLTGSPELCDTEGATHYPLTQTPCTARPQNKTRTTECGNTRHKVRVGGPRSANREPSQRSSWERARRSGRLGQLRRERERRRAERRAYMYARCAYMNVK